MRKLALGMALASTALATPALARDSQWYVGVEGGAMIAEDLSMNVAGNNGAFEVDHDAGYDFDGIVGYDFGGFRLEAEVGYKSAAADRVQAGAPGLPQTEWFRSNGHWSLFNQWRSKCAQLHAERFA